MSLLRRLLNVLRPESLDRDFEEELEFHRQLRERKNREEGMRDAEAGQEAKRRMGNLTLAKEEMRDARAVRWFASSLRDLRHGVFLLRRDAGVSGLIVLVLALGIGGNAAIFTLLKTAFVNALPYRDAGRLVTVLRENDWAPSVAEYNAIRNRSRTLEQIAYVESGDMQVSGTGEPIRVYAARVTAAFFGLLGARASLGRALAAEDDQPGRMPVVVLSESFWRSKFGADPQVVGRLLRLDSQPALVVGVLTPDFHFDYPMLRIAEPVDLYISCPIDPLAAPSRGGPRLTVPARLLARLREGVTLSQAKSELRQIGQTFARQHPLVYRTREGKPGSLIFQISSLREAILGYQRSLLWLLGSGVGCLLLIACANAAQLLLGRSLVRRREMAVRAALGASRLDLIRQFFLEALVPATCGGLAGLLVAGPIVRLLVSMLPVPNPMLATAHVDGGVLVFTGTLSLVCAIGFAVIPAIKGSRWSPGPVMQTRSFVGEGNRWRNIMTAFEAALSIFLLCGAGLVVQNLWTLVLTPVGFDPDHTVAMQLKLPSEAANSLGTKASAILESYLKKIAAIPGIDSAATVTGPPLRRAIGGPAEIVGERDPNGALKTVIADLSSVSPDYFRTLRIPIFAGRPFETSDAAGRPLVAIVNQEFALRFGLAEDVVGRQLDDPKEPFTIVGMVGNVRTQGLSAAASPEVYLSSAQFAWANVYLVVRSRLPAAEVLKAVTGAIHSENADQAVFGVTTMKELISDSMAGPRFYAFLTAAFASVALAMSSCGMFSVISFLVSQRRSEIAIRVTLGASRGAIVRTIAGGITSWVAGGLLCGFALALGTRNTVRALSSSAVEGSPWMYVFVVLFFFVVTLLAVSLPLRRISHIDPALTLRCE